MQGCITLRQDFERRVTCQNMEGRFATPTRQIIIYFTFRLTQHMNLLRKNRTPICQSHWSQS